MDIKNMHYDFKQKLNKIDSKAYRGLKIPEIDWKLNEALEVFILMIAEPRFKNLMGFESNQRNIDDLRSIVKNDVILTLTKPPAGGVTINFVTALFPADYFYYLSTSQLHASKGDCEADLKTIVIQHDDRNNDESFYNSSFEWRECNIRFYSSGIKIFNPDFSVESFAINYLRAPAYMHNAEDYPGDTYNLPDGTALIGSQNCELPVTTHREIVDLAVLLTTGDLDLPLAYQFKSAKTKLVQLT